MLSDLAAGRSLDGDAAGLLRRLLVSRIIGPGGLHPHQVASGLQGQRHRPLTPVVRIGFRRICAPHPYILFGGIKGSLLGTNKVQGKDGIDFFTQNKVVTVRTSPKDKIETVEIKSPRIRSCVAS